MIEYGLLVANAAQQAAVLTIAIAVRGCFLTAPAVSEGSAEPSVAVAVAAAAASRPEPMIADGEPGRQPLEALQAPAPFLDLPVPHHRDAVVSLPLGATTPRPVLVAAHGAGDRPEWQCTMWRGIVGDRAFVLCPRGFPMNPYVPPSDTGYFYTTHHALGREITLAFEALRARFPDHVDAEAPAYAGFSQGAIMGALLLPNHPVRFTRAALVEGGYGLFQEWNIPVAQAFQRRGGGRVLLACGRPECAEQAQVTAGYMRRAGLEARVIHAKGAGHSYGGVMEEELRRVFAWVIEGDPRW
jgi:predicted esterase